jgi:DNA/RNA-binding domain of Phe-tRNA-synthetase-like protein
MKFIVKNEIFDIFPGLRIGIVVGKGLHTRKRANEMDGLIKENSDKLLKTVGEGEGNLAGFVNIAAWRETYRRFGASPNKYKPTAEAFLKRILKGNAFPNINTSVDAYLAVELLTMLPIGGYDLDKITGDIVLRVSQGNESFHPIGGGDPETTTPGEIIYCDDRLVLTRNWNYRDSDITKITEDTTNIFLAVEAALGDINTEDVALTVDKIVEYETRYCGGEYQTYFLDKQNPEIQVKINH